MNTQFKLTATTFNCLSVKGIVSIVLRDPPRKDDSAPFTTVPLEPIADQYGGRYLSWFKRD